MSSRDLTTHTSLLRPARAAVQEPPTSLDGHGVFAIIVFAVVTLIVIWPIRIPIPFAVSERVAKVWHRAAGPEATAARTPDQHIDPGRRGEPLPRVPLTLGSSTSPRGSQRRYISLTHVSAPAIGILFLLATRTIGGEQIRLGIVGDGGVKPYSVLALFISLAYIAISLDATGLLRYLALHVSLKGGRSGPRLFYLLYAFFFLLGLLVGNDPVILSGTAFLVHFTRISGISRPDAWIWAQFSAANISSALLVSSNPTNIVIASGFGVEFTTYSAFMALPTIASGLTALVVVRLIFVTQKAGKWSLMGYILPGGNRGNAGRRSNKTASQSGTQQSEAAAADTSAATAVEGETSPAAPASLHPPQGRSTSPARDIVYIPPYLIPPDVRPREALVDPFGAIFGSIVMAATLIVLVGTSVTGAVEVYEIALPGAAICLLRDILKDLKDGRTERKARQKMSTNQSVESSAEPAVDAPGEAIELQKIGSAPGQTGERENANASSLTASGAVFNLGPARRMLLKSLQFPSWFAKTFPTVTAVFTRLPLPLLPFAFGMFILVESLAHVGFIDIMASGLGKVCSGAGEIGTALFIGCLSVLLCNLGGTNIGACIILVRAIVSTPFSQHLSSESTASITQTAIYALALGSNVGALGGTFAASLAGLLWRESLRQGGIQLRARHIAIWSLLTAPLALLSGLIVVWAQVRSGRWP
ncbi:hypothetical protein BCV69DRAFT_246454 [Microstroma glucosiphilum]|uniref:Citrate transporter-like domain-containing protein n=1 Tax=Pseudomicrostroma glucosiphilum TaxID=1684307 RepID=A0A316UCH3_9BASI|nr:hypothetical protein BCV69DRAFT_246454 [Pseudomicrostroma glucosiphilum]PWN22103.1 hypothetical protein BCV69DRAFT_246454 [Pseudomicrostroma glucosiphilum]